jgi:hypothetical protein
MRAEHRHELQTNLLANQMGRLLESMKSPGKSRTKLTWVFVILTIGCLVVWQIYAGATQAEHSALWFRLDTATHDLHRGMSDLAALAHDGQGTFAARAARFNLARLRLEDGQSPVTAFQRADAAKSLKEARKSYEELASQCADQPILAQEAMMGVAKADEALIGISTPDDVQKDLEQALLSYRRLAERYPNSVLGKAAQERITELEARKPEVTKFYAELGQSADFGKAPVPETP